MLQQNRRKLPSSEYLTRKWENLSKFVLDIPPLLGNKPHIDFIKSFKKQRTYYLIFY